MSVQKLSRRSFIGMALCAASAAALPAILSPDKLTIMSDGIADDSDALQAAIDGKTFHDPTGRVSFRAGVLRISGGHFKLSKPIHISRHQRIEISYCRFTMVDGAKICVTR